MTKPYYQEIPLSELKLDSKNPRMPVSYHGKEEEDIIEYMLLDASLIELMLAIGENDFFPGEQLLVVKESDNKYKVIEGNRRLSAVKLLSHPELARIQKIKIEKVLAETTFRPKNIPCLVFNDENKIHNYLGYRHITGIKEWKLLEKARYLSDLRKQNYSTLDVNQASRVIAKIIGSTKDYVKRILTGFVIYRTIEDEAFYKIRDLNDTTFHFNYIADSLNKSNIVAFLGVDFEEKDPTQNINSKNLRKWTEWLFEKNEQNKTRVIGTSGDLGKLNKILGIDSATIAFDNGLELDRAYELTEDLKEIFKDSIAKSLQYLERADNVVHRVNEFYPDLEEDLVSIRKLTQKIKLTKDNSSDEKF